jgi:hypothetical protein
MIRRDFAAGDGAPKRWALIAQIDHARLAARLAEHWGAGSFAPLVPREELLWAIAHHDDGWREWDLAPQVDPVAGVPRAFTEMEIDDSLAIWSASIDGAAQAGNLQGYVVAGHFCALARRAAAWRKADPAWPRADAFITGYEGRMAAWLADWQKENRSANTPEIARRALAQLQFFDSLSLWFCCAEATGPDTVETPDGPELTLAPEGSQLVRLWGWPLAVDHLELEIPGRIVPAERYGSSQLLAAASSEGVLLRWQLRPAAGAGQKV